MLLIERWMARVVAFIACDVFGLDSRDVERARARDLGRKAPAAVRPRDRQVVVRFGR